MKKTIGFIGGGNMGRAMMAGLLKSGQYQPTEVYVFDPSVKVRKHLEDTLGVQPTTTVEDLITQGLSS